MTTDPYPNQCPDLMPTSSGKPHLGATGLPYRCELGLDHGGPVHLGGGCRWPNRDYVPRPPRPHSVTENASIVRTLMAEVRMEAREFGADAEYLLQGLGQMFQRAYDAGRESALGPGMTRDQMTEALRRRGLPEG